MAEEFRAVATLDDLLSAKFKSMGRDINEGFDRMSRDAKKFSDKTTMSLKNVKGGILKLKTASILLGGILTGVVARAFIKAGAEMENYTTQFEVLLGSAGAAKDKIQELTEFSKKTPFQFKDLAEAEKLMLSFGLEANKTSKYLKVLGDISLGNKQRFQSLSLAFSQAQSAGKLMGQDLLQMINAGFNPLKEISKTTGESILQLKERMGSAAGISAKELSEAFENATKKGGQFHNGLQRMSSTVTGLSSTFQDQLGAAMRDMMESGVWDNILLGMENLVSVMSKALESKLFAKWGRQIGMVTDKIIELLGIEQTGISNWEKRIDLVSKVNDKLTGIQRLNIEIDQLDKKRLETANGFLGTSRTSEILRKQEIEKKNQLKILEAEIARIAGKSYLDNKKDLDVEIDRLNKKEHELSLVKKIKAPEAKDPKIVSEKEQKALEKQQLADENRIEQAQKLQDDLYVMTLTGREREQGELILWMERKREILELGGEDTLQLMEAFKNKEQSINDKYIAKEKQKLAKAKSIEQKEQDKEKAKTLKFNDDLASAKVALTDTLIAQSSRGLQLFIKNEKAAKKVAFVTSLIQGALAVQKSLAAAPPPINYALAAATGVIAAVNSATIASQAFQGGGIIQGQNAFIRANEDGRKESILNAQATSNLGVGGVNALNSGQSITNHTVNTFQFSPSVTTSGNDESAIMTALMDLKPQFAEFFNEEMVGKGYIKA